MSRLRYDTIRIEQAMRPHSAIRACVLAISAFGGCSTSHTTTPASTIERVREQWVEDWATQTAPPLGSTYKAYRVSELHAAERGTAFEALAGTIEVLQASLSGENVIDLLGTPNLWSYERESTIGLVYFFHRDGRLWEAYFQISGDGKRIVVVGWNDASVNPNGTLGYHP